MARRGIAIFLFISLALSVIPAIQNNYTQPLFVTAQTVDTELSTEQKRLINQTTLRVINANPSFVGNGTIITPSPAAVMMVPALAQVIERIVVQTSNPSQIITHLAIETAANPTGPISQGLLLFAQRLAVGDTTGVSQLASLIAQLTESSTANVTTQAEDITGNISQLIVRQAFQSALGANQLLNQVANKLAANSSKLSVNNVTISSDAIAQAIQQIIIQVSLQPQGVLSFQPLLFIANQVNQNPLGPLSKSIVQLAQLQITGGLGASQSIAQSMSELVKQITTGNLTTLIGSVPTIEPTSSEGQDQDRRTKIIIRDEFDERDFPIFQPPSPPRTDEEVPIFQENFTELQPPSPPFLEDNLNELQPPITNDTSPIINRTETGDTTRPPPIIRNFTSPSQLPEEETVAPPEPPTPTDTNETAQLKIITEVINDGGGSQVAGNFSIFILNENATFSVGGPVPAAPAPDGTTIDLALGTYKVLESPLIEYGITFEGDCDTTGKVTLVADGPPKTCTVKLNDRIPGTIKVVTDVINDNGGNKTARHFRFNIVTPGFQTMTISGQPPPDGITFPILFDRTFTVQQDAVPGYTTSFEGDCNNVAVVENQTKTCTIINDDVAGAELRVITQVINDSGGNKTAEDFRIFLLDASETFTPGIIPAVPPPHGTILDKRPGTYFIIGSLLGNYGTTFEGDCDGSGRVTLAADDTAKSCTIIINDVEGVQLKVITEVINDSGGNKTAEDFNIRILKANATTSANALRTSLVAGPLPGAPAPDGTVFDLAPGTYVVSGSPLGNYGTTFEGDCDSRARVTLAVADETPKACTIKFQDRLPGLVKAKVVTDVINDNGGNKTARDFRFDIVTPTFLFSGVSGSPPPDGRTFNMNAFSYTINPRADPGYTTTLQGDCIDVLVVENLTKTCTIVNNDIVADDGLLSPQPPTPVTGNQTNATLILNIRVINDDGVSIQPQDLGATIDVFGNNFRNRTSTVVAQIPASNGSRDTFSVQPGTYTINFSPGHLIANFLGNYSFGNTCRGPQVLGAGDTKTCFTTFNDIEQPTNGSQTSSTGSLSVKTHIINDNTNSTLEASDVFMLLMLGQIQQLFKGSEEGITFTLPANTSYFVFADQQRAHTTSRSGDCGSLAGLGGERAMILAGENKTCTITLDDTGGSAQILSAGNTTLQNLTSFSTTTPEKEAICDDGIDNDNDVKVDATDEDCFFTSSSPKTDENATTTSLPPPTKPEQGPTQTQEQVQPKENSPPTADAGGDFTTESGNTAKLNGEGSSDPDEDQTLSYSWEQVSPSSPSVSLNGQEEEVASFKAPEVDEDTKFRFELTVNDGKGGQDTDSVTVAILGSGDKEEVKEEEQEQEEQEQEEQEQEEQEVEA